MDGISDTNTEEQILLCIDVLTDDVRLLRTDVKEVQCRLGRFETDVRNRFDLIEADVKDVQCRLGRVETDVKDVQCRLGRVETDVKDVQVRLGRVEKEVKEVQVRLGRVEKDVKDIKTDVNRRFDELASGVNDIKETLRKMNGHRFTAESTSKGIEG